MEEAEKKQEIQRGDTTSMQIWFAPENLWRVENTSAARQVVVLPQ